MAQELLREFFELCPGGVCQDILTEDEKRYMKEGGLILSGKIQEADVKNGNGRKYSERILRREIEKYQSQWVNYLPRPNVVNNRKSLTLTNLPGKTHQDSPSQAQAIVELGRHVSELEFNVPTEVMLATDVELLWKEMAPEVSEVNVNPLVLDALISTVIMLP